MIIIFIRSTITYIVLLILMRMMGKRQIGEMQPFELVITLLIAELACIPMADISVPLIYGIAAILAVFVLHQLFSIVEQTNQNAKRAISGKPSLVLNKDGVDFNELKKNNMDVDDLIESMRAAGYFSLDELDYAIFESNGKLSAKEKNIKKSDNNSLPILVISGGKIIDNNLELLKITRSELCKIIKDHGAKDDKQVGVMTVDGNGKVYFQKENARYETFNISLSGGVEW